MVVPEASSGFTFSNLVRFDPAGRGVTIASNLLGYINGIELDGDNTWICASASTELFGVNHTTGAVTTYISSSYPYPIFNEVAILREGRLLAVPRASGPLRDRYRETIAASSASAREEVAR